MYSIRSLTALQPEILRRLVIGYTSGAKYQIKTMDGGDRFTLDVELTPLPQPYIKHYNEIDAESMEEYQRVAALGFTYAAYDNQECVGIALAEPRLWNKSLWVWELHVAEDHRGQGIGRLLVEALCEKSRMAGLRTIVCETQNTNAPAIAFYRRIGFRIEGVDLSYYSNEDTPEGETAIFMKKRQ